MGDGLARVIPFRPRLEAPPEEPLSWHDAHRFERGARYREIPSGSHRLLHRGVGGAAAHGDGPVGARAAVPRPRDRRDVDLHGVGGDGRRRLRAGVLGSPPVALGGSDARRVGTG